MLDDDDHVFCVEVVRRERKMCFLHDISYYSFEEKKTKKRLCSGMLWFLTMLDDVNLFFIHFLR